MMRPSSGSSLPVDQPLLKALQERERHLAAAQRLARLGSWEWDVAADRMSWSDEMYRILGLEPQELEASLAGMLARVHPDDLLLVEDAVLRTRTVHEPYEIRHRVIRADGSVCFVEARATVAADRAGAAARIHGALQELADTVPSDGGAAESAELVRALAVGLVDAASVEDALRVALVEICRHRRWPLGRAWLRDTDGAGLLVPGHICYGDGVERTAPVPDLAAVLRPGVGLAGRSLVTRRLEWGFHGLDRRQAEADPAEHALKWREVFALPVIVEHEVLAVLQFFSPDPVARSDVLDAAMRGLAAMLAHTIDGSAGTYRRHAGQEQFRALVANVRDPLLVVDAAGTIRCSSPSVTELLGQPFDAESGAVVFDLLHPNDRDGVRSALQSLADGGGTAGPLEFRLSHSEGSWREVEATAVDVREVSAIEGALVVIARAVSEQRAAETGSTHGEPLDRLTGLGGRAAFLEHVERALAENRSASSTAVLTYDIDQFRRVNDEFGHGVGDGLLVEVAQRLETALRQHDTVARPAATVARLGADQFLVLCEHVPDATAAGAIAARMLEVIGAPLALGDQVLSVTASAGIALAGPDDEPERLMLDAEAALHEAKAQGGGRYAFFSAERHHHAAAATALNNALARALERDEFRIVYQPKVSLATDKIIGVEALLRWDHPEQGHVPPAEFIPVAEASGLVVDIGAWVLGEACRQGATWQQAYPVVPPLHVAVNVSARQFRSELADTVRTAIADSGIAAAGLCLELTETTVMDDVSTAITVLGELKELGLIVSIDDFGTGYSSLAQLRRLPLDEVKIDKSFVDGLGADPEDTAIVAAVISLAHALDREVVAEGVETLEQLERLRALGCDFAQGYYLSRPVSAPDLTELLTRDAAGQRLPHGGACPATATGPSTETVLVADDATDVRQLARMSLTSAGFTVAEAADGVTALAAARHLLPDCVVLDVRMPDMTGIEVCRALRSDQRTADCTIVILTSRADAADKAEAFSAGADDYIVKPFAPRDLVARVRTAVRRRRQQNDLA